MITDSSELKLYEILGVKQFKKLIFKIENFRHHNDKRRNRNYHLKDGTLSSLKSFTGYLLYNTMCHVISLFYIAVYFAVTRFNEIRYFALDISMYILIVINLYCIMLQRYSYIKMRVQIERKTKLRKKQLKIQAQCLKSVIENKNYLDLQEEYKLIQYIKTHIQNGIDCFLTDMDAVVLNRISLNVGDILKSCQGSVNKSSCNKDFTQVISSIPKCPLVIEKIERRTEKLQNVLHLDKRSNIAFCFGIITETYKCEDAYNRLFPRTSRDSMEYVIEVLFEAYSMYFGLNNKKEHETISGQQCKLRKKICVQQSSF